MNRETKEEGVGEKGLVEPQEVFPKQFSNNRLDTYQTVYFDTQVPYQAGDDDGDDDVSVDDDDDVLN